MNNTVKKEETKKEQSVTTKPTGNAVALGDLLKKGGPSLQERTTEDFAIPYLNIISDTLIRKTHNIFLTQRRE